MDLLDFELLLVVAPNGLQLPIILQSGGETAPPKESLPKRFLVINSICSPRNERLSRYRGRRCLLLLDSKAMGQAKLKES